VLRVKVITILHLVDVLGSRETVLEVPEGTTVTGLMKLLVERCDPAQAGQVFADSEGTLQPSITVMVNGRLVAFAGGLEAALSEGDEVLILPAVGGG